MRIKEPIPEVVYQDNLFGFCTYSHVFLCCIPEDANTFLSTYGSSFPDHGKLLFIATGATPVKTEIVGLSKRIRNQKIGMILPNDLLGQIAAIKIAVWLRNLEVKISYIMQDTQLLEITFNNKHYKFHENKLSLSTFEKATGFRSKIRIYHKIFNKV